MKALDPELGVRGAGSPGLPVGAQEPASCASSALSQADFIR